MLNNLKKKIMKKINKSLSLGVRIKSPTPSFFKKIRTIGLIVGAIGAALLAAPISLPAVVTALAGYLATAGLVATAVSSATVEEK
jgi:ABC-type xylose transport system permease subunit